MKNGIKTRTAAAVRDTVIGKVGAQRASKIKFGSVTVVGSAPSAESMKINVERSSRALERAAKKLLRPGVDLRAKKNVPQFSVAEGETGIFVRRLNGRIERGRLVNGAFQVID